MSPASADAASADAASSAPRPVVVVTGGGAGIGAAIAEELGRSGWFVVTVDPLVTLDGSAQLPDTEETTAGRIVAAGGSARASDISVTDGDAVSGLFTSLVDEFGRLDAVINVAGISRPTGFARGKEEDWRGVLSVHLDGYLNVLGAALPIMATAGRGRILGVTSGSGWRQADAGAYSCAKRAVAALTWQLGREAPAGVTVNAVSPIAVTRMVTAALDAARAKSGSGSSSTGGLSLGSMPTPTEIGPFGAHLVGEAFDWCSGRIFFAGGSEVALIEEPHLLEAVRVDDEASTVQLVDTFVAGALVPAEAQQASGGGSNPRFPAIFDETVDLERVPADLGACAIVSDRSDVAAGIIAALETRGVSCRRIPPGEVDDGFAAAADALSASVDRDGPIDAVVVALAEPPHPSASGAPWERIISEHAGLVDRLREDARWTRAVADHARGTDRAIRLVTLSDAVTSGGRSRAQASAQLARSALGATGERVAAFAISVETTDVGPVSELVAHLASTPDVIALSGAELVAGGGWIGLRSHPRPTGSITIGGPGLPDWLDDMLRTVVGEPRRAESSDIVRGEELS